MLYYIYIIEDYEDDKVVKSRFTKRAIIIGVSFVLVAVIVAVVCVLLLTESTGTEKTESPSAAPSMAPTAATFTTVVSIIVGAGVSKMSDFAMTDAPQYRAATHLAEFDNYVKDEGLLVSSDEDKIEKFIQRYILTVFYFSTGGDGWTDCGKGDAGCRVPGTESYLGDTDECDWVGSDCDDGKLTGLEFIGECKYAHASPIQKMFFFLFVVLAHILRPFKLTLFLLLAIINSSS